MSGRLPERGRKKKRNDRRGKECPNSLHSHLLQAQYALALLQTAPPPPPPPLALKVLSSIARPQPTPKPMDAALTIQNVLHYSCKALHYHLFVIYYQIYVLYVRRSSRHSLKDCESHCGCNKTEASLER